MRKKKNKIGHAVRIYCFWWKRRVIFFFDESKIYIITFFYSRCRATFSLQK